MKLTEHNWEETFSIIQISFHTLISICLFFLFQEFQVKKYMAFILKKMGLKRLIGFDFIITKIMNYLFKK